MSKTDSLVVVRDMAKSHRDTLRWRCYYAAFERKYRRKSDGHEFCDATMAAVDAVLSVVKDDVGKLLA